MVLLCSLIRLVFHIVVKDDIKLNEPHYVEVAYFSLFYSLMIALESITIFFLSCALFSYMHWIPQIGFFLTA